MSAPDLDASMPLKVERYRRDTQHLTTEQHGAYMLLLMEGWIRGGVLPAQDAQLAAIARMPPGRWRTLGKPALMPFFREDGAGGLVQKRLQQEIERAERIRTARAEGGRKRQQNGSSPAEKPQQKASSLANLLPKKAANGQLMGGRGGSPFPSSTSSQPVPDDPQHGVEADASTPRRAGVVGSTATTTAGEVCRAMKAAGIARCNPSHPVLLALIEQGATLEEFASHASDVAQKPQGVNHPFHYVLQVVQGERERAHAVRLAPPAPARAGSLADFNEQLAALKGQA